MDAMAPKGGQFSSFFFFLGGGGGEHHVSLNYMTGCSVGLEDRRIGESSYYLKFSSKISLFKWSLY